MLRGLEWVLEPFSGSGRDFEGASAGLAPR